MPEPGCGKPPAAERGGVRLRESGALRSRGAIDPNTLPAGTGDTNPLGIAPFLNYRLSKGWYVGNGDMVARWDWDENKFSLPIGVRVGKVIVQEKSSWNLYVEYRTSLIYEDWPGSAVKNSWRFNASNTLPVGL